MDIDYLLLLQNFRNSTNNSLTPFMEAISLFAVTYLILLPVFVYWVVSKRDGLYVLSSFYSAITVNAAVKLTACVYRPWIRDARVLPAGDAITTATGYSFPSGHTMSAGPMYGGLAVISRKKWKWLSVLWVLALLITGFSRNYLGVHTPQDVIVGVLLSCLMLFVMDRIFRCLALHPDWEKWFLLGGFLFGWAVIAYITWKPYPMDYVDGKLLVDPQKMMNDGYGDTAKLISFCAARFIESRWIGFRSTGFKVRGLIVAALGMAGLWALLTFLKAPLDAALGTHWGHFVNDFIIVFYIVAIVPLCIKLFGGQADEKA